MKTAKWWEELTPEKKREWKIFERADEFYLGQKVKYLGVEVTVTAIQESRPPMFFYGKGYGGLEISWMEPAEHGLAKKNQIYLSADEVEKLIAV